MGGEARGHWKNHEEIQKDGEVKGDGSCRFVFLLFVI